MIGVICGYFDEQYNNGWKGLYDDLEGLTLDSRKGEKMPYRMAYNIGTSVDVAEQIIAKLLNDTFKIGYNKDKSWRDGLANSEATFANVVQPMVGMKMKYQGNGHGGFDPLKQTNCFGFVDWSLTFAASGGDYNLTKKYYESEGAYLPSSIKDLTNKIIGDQGKEAIITNPKEIKPGDVLVTRSHITIVLDNNTFKEVITYANSSKNGSTIGTVSYNNIYTGKTGKLFDNNGNFWVENKTSGQVAISTEQYYQNKASEISKMNDAKTVTTPTPNLSTNQKQSIKQESIKPSINKGILDEIKTKKSEIVKPSAKSEIIDKKNQKNMLL